MWILYIKTNPNCTHISLTTEIYLSLEKDEQQELIDR